MKDRIAKLINVKSFVTILLTIAFVVLSFKGRISELNFMEIFKLIIIFYFGTQVGKSTKGDI